jgi:hypothetical protein
MRANGVAADPESNFAVSHWPQVACGSGRELEGFVARSGPGQPYQWQGFATLEYLQLDYVVNSHVTIVAGRFLTRFNIYDVSNQSGRETATPRTMAPLLEPDVRVPMG